MSLKDTTKQIKDAFLLLFSFLLSFVSYFLFFDFFRMNNNHLLLLLLRGVKKIEKIKHREFSENKIFVIISKNLGSLFKTSDERQHEGFLLSLLYY